MDDGGCAHARLPLSTLTNILARLQCGDRMRAIAIRATTTTTLEGRGGGINLLRAFGPFRYRVILGLLLLPRVC
jgi:hypothetical protein